MRWMRVGGKGASVGEEMGGDEWRGVGWAGRGMVVRCGWGEGVGWDVEEGGVMGWVEDSTAICVGPRMCCTEAIWWV